MNNARLLLPSHGLVRFVLRVTQSCSSSTLSAELKSDWFGPALDLVYERREEYNCRDSCICVVTMY